MNLSSNLFLRHVIRRIHANWPRVAITVRGGGHHGTPEVMEVLEAMGCLYILALLMAMVTLAPPP